MLPFGVSPFLDDEGPVSQEDFLQKLFPRPWDALAVLLAFVVLAVAVFFLAYKPVKKLLAKRSEYVEGKIKNAERSEKMAGEHERSAAASILASKKDAASIISKARTDALAEREKLAGETDELLRKKKIEAEKDLERQVEKSRETMRKDIVDVALIASEKVLGREVKREDDARLVDEFIAGLDKENKEGGK